MNKIKLIIFDLDGTLYNLNDVVTMNYQMQLNFYSAYTSKSKKEVIEIFEKNNIFPVMTEKSKFATEFFARMDISVDEWNDYRESLFDVTAICTKNAVGFELIEKFRYFSPLVLLSSNSLNNIHRILKYINISSDLFDEIVCSDNKYGDGIFKKIDEMKLIAERKCISTNAMLSIGDRYKTDIDPIIRLGGQGIVVDGPQDLKVVYEAMKSKDFTNIKIFGA